MIKWMSHTTNAMAVEHILSIDQTDPCVSEYLKYFPRAIIGDNANVVQATNRAAKEAKGDILVYLSDDFDAPFAWDEFLRQQLGDGSEKILLKVDDGLQPFENEVLTIPIMTRALYQELGYFFYPEYASMWVDVDLYYTCAPYIKRCPQVTFQHNHYCNGKAVKDETYTRSEGNWNQGLDVFTRRFPSTQPFKKK
jgi:glycosyltransferase involved in cell wall biosynthesis